MIEGAVTYPAQAIEGGLETVAEVERDLIGEITIRITLR